MSRSAIISMELSLLEVGSVRRIAREMIALPNSDGKYRTAIKSFDARC